MASSIPDAVLIVGGGPAGLTAAYELVKRGAKPIVFERSDILGGIARTEEYRGYRFDIGGHRFFTKVKRVNDTWDDVLGDRMLRGVPRLSRIYYNDSFFQYPLKLGNVIRGLGVWNSLLIFLSYLRAQAFPQEEEENFEQWIVNRFGQRLYRTFFKTYTEKVWGIPCTEIRAEWAGQRIQGLSMKSALKSAVLGNKGNAVKSLIDAFDYPECGPGQMWEEMGRLIEEGGGKVLRRHDVVAIHHDGRRVTGLEVEHDGRVKMYEGSDVVASMPLSTAIRQLRPPPPDEVLEAAGNLRYRDFLTVGVIVDAPDLFPDNWIYIHSPDVRMGRLQNFKNWSPGMVADPNKTTLGAEFFVNVGDDLWVMDDDDLVDLTIQELDRLQLLDGAKVEDGVVFRQPKAYPIYGETYARDVEVLKARIMELENLQMVGRNGLHRYNNQDHSMLSAMYAVDNLFGADRDLWSVNTEQEYHEEDSGEK